MRKLLIVSLVLVILILSVLVGCNFLLPDKSESTDVLENTIYTMDDFRHDWPEAIKVRVSDLDEYNIVGSILDTDRQYVWLVPVTTGGYIWIIPMHSIQD